jgi:hypothetical protein
VCEQRPWNASSGILFGVVLTAINTAFVAPVAEACSRAWFCQCFCSVPFDAWNAIAGTTTSFSARGRSVSRLEIVKDRSWGRTPQALQVSAIGYEIVNSLYNVDVAASIKQRSDIQLASLSEGQMREARIPIEACIYLGLGAADMLISAELITMISGTTAAPLTLVME